MSNKIITQQGPVVAFEKASQTFPYTLLRSPFKRIINRNLLNKFKEIARNYFPNYTDKDIAKLFKLLSNEGCTYATMANIIMEQFGNDNNTFYEYFGYSLCNKDGTINFNKLMVDIFACISQMVELKVTTFNTRSFSSPIEAAKILLNKECFDNNQAHLLLFNAGWFGNGFDDRGLLLFSNKQNPKTETFIGTYRELGKSIFNIDDPSMNQEKFNILFKEQKKDYSCYSFDFFDIASKFSGLSSVIEKNIKKWLNIYFEKKGIDLIIETYVINTYKKSYDAVKEELYAFLDEGYSFKVSPSTCSNVYMTDGTIFGWGKIDHHAMNFEGFDPDGNILVCSWGKHHMIPKEYYNELEYVGIRLVNNTKRANKER